MSRHRRRSFESTAEVLDRLLTQVFASLAEEDEVLGPGPPLGVEPSALPAPRVAKALEDARSVLAQLEGWRADEERRAEGLLTEAAPERWRRVAEDPGFHRPRVIERLLSAGATAGLAGDDAEAGEISLLALHLTERLEPERHPAGLVGDLLCRALALRVEHLIHQRRLRAAELAALRTRDLLLESSDPLVAFDVGLASAFLSWAEGDREGALKLFNDLGRLAGVLGEIDRAGELCLWCCLLLVELGDPETAAGLKARADDLLGTPAVEECWARVRARHLALHLSEAPPARESPVSTVH